MLTYDDVAIVANVAGVTGTSVEMPTNQPVKANGTTLTDVQLVGTTPDYPSVREVSLADGRFLNAQDMERKTKVAVLGASVAQEIFGDADPIGQSITVDNVKLTVVGVMANKGVVGNTDFDARVYTPVTLVYDRFVPSQFARFLGNRVQLIFAQIDEGANMDDVKTQIQLKLASSKGVTVAELPFTIVPQPAGLGGRRVVDRRRHRDHEHHAGQRHRADARDRHPPVGWRDTQRHPPAVPG